LPHCHFIDIDSHRSGSNNVVEVGWRCI
jgi:hypothetical protein